MMAPDIQTAILYREGLHSPWAYAKMGATAVHPNYRYLQDAVAELTMESDVEVRPYTINEETLMRKYFDMNISAIITDYPETARALLPIKNETACNGLIFYL